MRAGKAMLLVLVVLAVAAAGVVLVVLAPQWYAASQPVPRAQGAAPSETAARKIKATLFYVSESGERLVAVDREIPYGDGVVEQAKLIVEAEAAGAPSPLATALPAGTKLRALYVTDRGEAYVDLSPEVAAGHPGGSLNELLTVYAIVNALTANLPAVSSVQMLVDGHEVDTLAGHVDLRRPLVRNQQWVQGG